MTEKQVRTAVETSVGLAVDTWSPGDGVTRYRFFYRSADSYGNNYFGGSNPLFTALGSKEAYAFIRGFRAGSGRH